MSEAEKPTPFAVLPRFSIRSLFLLMLVFAGVSFVLQQAFRGESWAIAVGIPFVFLAMFATIQAALFTLTWGVGALITKAFPEFHPYYEPPPQSYAARARRSVNTPLPNALQASNLPSDQAAQNEKVSDSSSNSPSGDSSPSGDPPPFGDPLTTEVTLEKSESDSSEVPREDG